MHHIEEVADVDPRVSLSIVCQRDWLENEWVVTHYVLLRSGQLLEDGQQRFNCDEHGPEDVERAVSALWERLHSLC